MISVYVLSSSHFALPSVYLASRRRLLNSGDTVYDGQVVYYNDAVTESFIRVQADQVTQGQYTLVLQGVGGATQKLLLYLRVRGSQALQQVALMLMLAWHGKALP